MKLCEVNECDLIVLQDVIVKQLSKKFKTSDELSFLGDFVTSIGAALTLIAGQRQRLESCKTEK